MVASFRLRALSLNMTAARRQRPGTMLTPPIRETAPRSWWPGMATRATRSLYGHDQRSSASACPGALTSPVGTPDHQLSPSDWTSLPDLPRFLPVSVSEGSTRMTLSVSGEVQYGKAERAFMIGERVVHDGVGRCGCKVVRVRCCGLM